MGQSGHGVDGRACPGGFGKQFELGYGEGALAMAGAQAIGAGIAAADDDDALAGGEDGFGVGDVVAFAAAVLLRQEIHGEVDALEFAAGDAEVARAVRRRRRAGWRGNRGAASSIGTLDADVGVDDEIDAFGAHLLDAAVDDGASPS